MVAAMQAVGCGPSTLGSRIQREPHVSDLDSPHDRPHAEAFPREGPSAPTVAPPAASGGEPDARGELLSVDPARLILGSRLHFPVLDKHGRLLLAAGQTVTPEFKRRLSDWGLREVEVHLEDSSRLGDGSSAARGGGPRAASPHAGRPQPTGVTYVTNLGPPVRDSVIRHGRRRYDPAHRQALIGTSDTATRCLDAMMHQALRGGVLDGDGVLRVAAGFLEHLTADIESVLTVPFTTLPDQAIASHCLQMSLYGMAIAVELGLNEANVRRVGVAGLLHDWGMLRVPREIREAQRRLNRVELLEVRKHPCYSLDLIEKLATVPSLVPLVAYQVHERLDGWGYPRGRKGTAIHLFARILHVADEYVSLTSPRPYRAALSPYRAIEALLGRDSGRCPDPTVVRALLRVVSLFPIGSYVRLSDGSTARVLRGNGGLYDRPIVQVVADAQQRKLLDTSDAVVDLAESPLRVVRALHTPGRKEIGKAPHYRRLLLARIPLRPPQSLTTCRKMFRDPGGDRRRPYVLRAKSGSSTRRATDPRPTARDATGAAAESGRNTT